MNTTNKQEKNRKPALYIFISARPRNMIDKHKIIAWGLLAESLFKHPSPQHLYIEPTNDCGLHCSICPNKADRRKTGYLNFNLFKKIIREIPFSANLENITLHKNGEPLLHPKLSQMIGYIKKHLPDVKISFSTSGVPLNKKLSLKILQSPSDEIYVSLGNILVDPKKDKRQIKIIDTARQNIKDFLALRNKLKKNGPKLTLRFIYKGNKNFTLLNPQKTKWAGLADKIEIRPYHNWCGYFKRPYAVPKNRTPCLNLWTTLAINWNGSVSICSLDYAGVGTLGSLKKESLKDIWKGENLRLYRKRHLDNDYKNLQPCKNCTEWRHNVGFWTPENLKKARCHL